MSALWWAAAGVLALQAAAAASVLVGVTRHATVAVLQDALVPLLAAAWPIGVAALVARRWPVAGAAGLLAGYHLWLLVPRLTRDRLPRWAASAPRVRLAVVNVYVDNETPDRLAAVVLGAAADLIVIAEWNDRFATAFDAAGGADAYPHRLLDPADRSDYAVAVVATRPLGDGSRMVRRGPLAAAQAVVDTPAGPLTLVALNPMAAVDPGGTPTWEAQLDELRRHLRGQRGALAVAGDLNATTARPHMRRLLALGLVDLHESLGRGLSASFKLAATGPPAAAGAVVRLDHVLTNARVRGLDAEDLDSAGSDHVPFVTDLAVRPRRRHGASDRS